MGVLVALMLRGYATFYADGVFQQVANNRHLPACQECVGYAALNHCSNLGRKIWVSNGNEWIGPLHVIDCAAARDLPFIESRNRVVEVDTWLARRWRMRGPIPVTVMDRPPRIERERNSKEDG